MNRKIAAPALAMMALAGCNLSRSDVKKKADQVTPTVFNTNSDRPGRVLEPKYCKLDSAILSRPVGDPVGRRLALERRRRAVDPARGPPGAARPTASGSG